jgi:hypothetical protein
MQCQGNQKLRIRMMRGREFFSVALRTQAGAMTRAREILARGLLGGTVTIRQLAIRALSGSARILSLLCARTRSESMAPATELAPTELRLAWQPDPPVAVRSR